MQSFLDQSAKRYGYDGWALRFRGATTPLAWTVSTTRAEVRQLKKERSDLFTDEYEIVKVRISLEVV